MILIASTLHDTYELVKCKIKIILAFKESFYYYWLLDLVYVQLKHYVVFTTLFELDSVEKEGVRVEVP